MTTPTREPTTVYAGDTITWTKTVDDYPASEGWTLSYTFRSPNGVELSVDATASGDDYSVSVPTEQSAKLSPGLVKWTAFITDAGDTQRFTVGSGIMTVVANPESTEASPDPRSFARQALEAVEAAIKENAGRSEGSVTYPDGRTISYRNHAELLQLRRELLNEVRAEEQAAKMAAGLDSGAIVRIRFSAT